MKSTFVSSFCFAVVATTTTTTINGFMITPTLKNLQRNDKTTLYLEDWVADMIDDELYRLGHKKEYENQWMEKNRDAVMFTLNKDSESLMSFDDDRENFRVHLKDRKLAENDPQRYCADRCVSTGNCDIYEDYFNLAPEDVIKFCTDCVLSEDEDAECEVPDGFYDNDGQLQP